MLDIMRMSATEAELARYTLLLDETVVPGIILAGGSVPK